MNKPSISSDKRDNKNARRDFIFLVVSVSESQGMSIPIIRLANAKEERPPL